MIKFIFSLIFALLTLICNAQSSEDRTVADFTKIAVSNGINVTFTQSASNSLTVEADSDKHLTAVVTEVKDGVLSISIDKNSKIHQFKKLNVLVSGINVSEFSVSSGASIECQGPISQPTFAISVSSGSRFEAETKSKSVAINATSGALIDMTADTENLTLQASSGTSITLSGKATNAAISATSGVTVKAKALKTKTTVIQASSGASVTISVSGSITANTDSSSSVHYFGSPRTEMVNQSKGSIRKN